MRGFYIVLNETKKWEICQQFKKKCNARIHSNQLSNLTCSFTRYCQNRSKKSNGKFKGACRDNSTSNTQYYFVATII